MMVIAFIAALATFQHLRAASEAWPAPVAAPLAGGDGVATHDALTARFGFCHSGGGNCVVDGDTFWFAGDKYRVADIDTPETHPARCAEEAALGAAATARLREWLNEGAFTLERTAREADRYGRKLRIATREGASVGSVLVAEGLARRWEGRRRSWCDGFFQVGAR